MTGRHVGTGNPNHAPEWVDCCWPRCEGQAEGGGPPLCPQHLREAGAAWLLAEGVSGLVGSRFPQADPGMISQEEHLIRRTEGMAAQSQVYYLRIGDHVKIGYTVNVRQRVIELRADLENLLATEPGGRSLERTRHLQFAAERVGKRENFNPSPRLLQWIDSVVKEHGPPRVTDYKSALEHLTA